MKIVYHLGTHNTDEGRILRCLLANKGVLSKQDIEAPGPSSYRAQLREAVNSLRGKAAPFDLQETILEKSLSNDHAKRVIFESENFICIPGRVFMEGELYGNVGAKTRALRMLFPDQPVEFTLATRDLATLVPTLAKRTKATSADELLDGANIREQRWSRVVRDIKSHNPDCEVTVWCNEDTPLLWPEVLQAVGGYESDTEIMGENDFIATLMTAEGMVRLEAYLKTHEPKNPQQRRRIVAAFLDKFGLEDELVEEVDLPGWTDDLVDALTESYEQDFYAMAQIPGVKVLAP